MTRECIICGRDIHSKRVDAKFCSGRCRVSHHRTVSRAETLPAELVTVPRWVRHDARKRPLVASSGRLASSTDAATWATYAEAKKSPHGVGLGFVLSAEDDIACIDIDDCVADGGVSPTALEVARATPDVFMVEVSRSGEGIHIWHHAPNAAGTNRDEGGLRVERYTQARYIAVTGKRIKI